MEPNDALVEPFADRLGKVADAVIARLAGVPTNVVCRVREARGIPRPARLRARMPPKVDRDKAWVVRIDEHSHRVGVATDAEVAELAGVQPGTVTLYREQRGIAPSPAEPPAPRSRRGRRSRLDGFRDVIGVLSDAEVAARAGVVVGTVYQYRRQHDIAAPPGQPVRSSKLDAHRDVIGVHPDAQVAAQVGVSRAAVVAYRKAHGIAAPPRAERRPGPDRPPGSMLDELRGVVGVLPDTVVAARAGVSREAVRAYREKHGIPVGARRRRGSRIDAFVEVVGVLSDGEVARRAGVTRAAVKLYRMRRGIAPSQARGGRKKAPMPASSARGSKIEAFRELVGVLTDGQVAARAGVTASAVHMYRRARGIAPAVPQGHHGPRPEVAPSAARPVAARAPNGGSWGWRVTLETEGVVVERFAVAPDAATACSTASRLGDVVRVERMGEALQ